MDTLIVAKAPAERLNHPKMKAVITQTECQIEFSVRRDRLLAIYRPVKSAHSG